VRLENLNDETMFELLGDVGLQDYFLF